MPSLPTFVLASASPARLRTLRAAGIAAEVVVSGVDESTVDSSSATALCATLARLKAETVVHTMARHGTAPRAGVVLGCDSVLEFAGEVLGKPVDEDDAVRRWQQMRGKAGILHTGHTLVDVASGTSAERVSSTTVRFADITDDQITAYVATGEPLQVAGAFTIDGLGGWFVDSIDGDPGTVVGLSLPVLRRLLADIGYSVEQFWPRAVTSTA